MAGEQLPDIHTGDLGEAWNVQNLTDLIKGLLGFPVSLTRHSSLTEPTLKLRNRLDGPILDIVWTNPIFPFNDISAFTVSKDGATTIKIAQYLDFAYYPALGSPAAPGGGSTTLRMYARGGQLYFKAEGSAEQQIPIGAPPGPSLRYGFWTAG